ncbi:MAG: PspC domain-containing protein [Bacteroidia bacterium]|nr:PspC domain-containing protein [Bacteroidia bacterium]
MNKTVNINLAGTFFHIDEDAFGKLQRYLAAIKKSLSDPQGSDEIIKDIEARIAELFSEKLEKSTQVVTMKELDEVIAVMGQPEDYMVDEEIFEDAPPRSRKSTSGHKQLYRDEDNKVIAGVSSGLGHYLGIDAVWVRLFWVLLTIFSSGIFILIYILFWIIVPPAVTTSEKLKMTGEPINISNIEKKFKEGYENVSEKVKNVDYDKYGEKVKSGATGFFETLGNILLTILKIFVKFFGIIIVFVSIITLIGLIIGLFTAGSFGFWGHGEAMDWYQLVDVTSAPLWLISLLCLFAIGIPFFVLFILGLKLLISNLRSIGTPAKVILLVLWIGSIVGLTIFGVKQMTETAFDGEVKSEAPLAIRSGDTLNIAMVSNELYEYDARRRGRLDIEYTENGDKIIYSTDVRLIVRSTSDSVGRILVERRAEGRDYLAAKKRAEAIDYSYNFDGSTLGLNAYFTTAIENNYRDQEVEVIVYLPIGSILYADDNTYSFHRNDSHYRDILNIGDEEQYLLIEDGETRCLTCPPKTDESWEENWDDDGSGVYVKDESGRYVRLDDGIKVKSADGDSIVIDEAGIRIDAANEEDTLKVKIGN